MELTRPFNTIGKGDANIAGGKGASLGEMIQAGIPVPPGFVILADAFEKFLVEANLNQELDTIFHTVNHQEIRTMDLASERIQALIIGAKMPEDIAAEISKNFKALGAQFVAVRSSATAEDSSSAAWAGQLDTFLNTIEENLLQNVQRCWASLFTPRAIFYRFEKGMHGSKISVAVVVQKMIQSEVSGIAFSVHPVTEDYNQLIVEAGFGLGEAIVSGQVTPDSFVIEKNPRRIIEKNITYQSRALWRGENGGNVWRDLSEEEGNKPALHDEQALELAELVLKIESHYGFPCDIEWAFEAGHFYITQSRPITTLSAKTETQDVPNEEMSETFKHHFTQSEMYVLDMDLLLSPVAYGIFDYLTLVENGILRCYLTSRGQDECDEFGRQLFDSAYVEKVKDNSTAVLKKLSDFKQPIITDTNALQQWNLENEFWDTFWSMYRHCDAPVMRPLEEVILQEADNQQVIEMLGNPNDSKRQKLSVAAQTALGTLEFLGEIKLKLHLQAEKLVTARDVFAEYLSKRFGISRLEVYAMRRDEITNALISGNIPYAEIKARLEGCVFVREGMMWNVLTGDMYREWKTRIERTQPTDISGSCAYPGIVQGKVIKHLAWVGVTEIPKGAVLVTGMTNPQMIPFIRNAAAIVTDEGGLTCHAAVISREFKIPCIVGTGNATSLLEDGDLIEVDAQKGTVRKI